jgi:flavodoxin
MPLGRCLVVVTSVHHGNTAHVARELADVLEAEVVTPEELPHPRLEDFRLVGLGSGVYYGRMHPSLLEWIRGLPDAALPARPAFIFSTSGLPFLAKIWHAPLRNLLADKGFDVIGEFSCRGFDTWGPLWLAGGLNKKHPDDRDLRRAREFAGRLTRAYVAE